MNIPVAQIENKPSVAEWKTQDPMSRKERAVACICMYIVLYVLIYVYIRGIIIRELLNDVSGYFLTHMTTSSTQTYRDHVENNKRIKADRVGERGKAELETEIRYDIFYCHCLAS